MKKASFQLLTISSKKVIQTNAVIRHFCTVNDYKLTLASLNQFKLSIEIELTDDQNVDAFVNKLNHLIYINTENFIIVPNKNYRDSNRKNAK